MRKLEINMGEGILLGRLGEVDDQKLHIDIILHLKRA